MLLSIHWNVIRLVGWVYVMLVWNSQLVLVTNFLVFLVLVTSDLAFYFLAFNLVGFLF